MENADQTYPADDSAQETPRQDASPNANPGAGCPPVQECGPQGYYYPPYQYPGQYPGAQPCQPYYQPAAPYQSADPYASYGYAPSGYAPSGYAPSGYAPSGYAPYGYGAYPPCPPYPPYGYAPAAYQPTPPQAAAPTAAPERQQESPAWHSIKWILAVIGVFFAVLGIQVVATFAIMAVAIVAGGGMDVVSWIMGDGLIIVEIIIQLVWLAVAVPWWLHVRKRGIGLFRDTSKEDDENALNIAWRVLGIVLLGFGAQIVVSIVLNLVLPLFPDVMTSYESLMEDTGLASEGIFTLIASAVLAPFVEEFTFRGIVMQFSLRAMCQQWTGRLTRENLMKMRIDPLQFWLANIFQAAVFGIMHLNLVQGLYAFVLGLVLGWVFWRTGRLRWCIGLHAAFNFSGYVLDGFYVFFDAIGLPGLVIEAAIAIVLVVVGIVMFRHFTKATKLPA